MRSSLYEAYYGLRGRPFELTPDPRFYFGSGGHDRALSYLRYGVLKREGFVVVTGEPGMGKTTLIHALLNELAENTDVVAAHVSMTQGDPDELIPMVAAAFGISREGSSKATLLQHLSQFLSEQICLAKQPILVIDEVQNLTVEALEALRILFNYQVGNVALFQGFLLGQPGFARVLWQAQQLEPLRQRVVSSCHLGPLGEEETRQYVLHRLQVVGWKDDPTFTEGAHRIIYQASAGIPRRINTLCDRSLLFGYLEDAHELDDQVLATVARELEEETGGWMRMGPRGQEIGVSAASLDGTGSPKHIPIDEPTTAIDDRIRILTERLATVEAQLAVLIGGEGDAGAMPVGKAIELQSQLAAALSSKTRLEQEVAALRSDTEHVRQTLRFELERLLKRFAQ